MRILAVSVFAVLLVATIAAPRRARGAGSKPEVTSEAAQEAIPQVPSQEPPKKDEKPEEKLAGM